MEQENTSQQLFDAVEITPGGYSQTCVSSTSLQYCPVILISCTDISVKPFNVELMFLGKCI